jgi:hypothetical protein
MIGVPIVGSPNTGDSQRAGLVADFPDQVLDNRDAD